MKMTLAAATAALIAAPVMADVDVSFDVSGPGGNGATADFELDGALAGMNVATDFTNLGGWTWAGDLLITIVDPNGNSLEFGGFDVTAGYASAGDFPSSWDSSTSGAYAHNASLASMGLGGSGTWTIGFYDGYTGGADTDHWIGIINLEGLEAVPAPGALALLGLAGLAGRRRRR
jgi:MYXO-CTERM domain-containing protein